MPPRQPLLVPLISFAQIVLFRCCGVIAINEWVPDGVCHGPTNSEEKAVVYLGLTRAENKGKLWQSHKYPVLRSPKQKE